MLNQCESYNFKQVYYQKYMRENQGRYRQAYHDQNYYERSSYSNHSHSHQKVQPDRYFKGSKELPLHDRALRQIKNTIHINSYDKYQLQPNLISKTQNYREIEEKSNSGMFKIKQRIQNILNTLQNQEQDQQRVDRSYNCRVKTEYAQNNKSYSPIHKNQTFLASTPKKIYYEKNKIEERVSYFNSYQKQKQKDRYTNQEYKYQRNDHKFFKNGHQYDDSNDLIVNGKNIHNEINKIQLRIEQLNNLKQTLLSPSNANQLKKNTPLIKEFKNEPIPVKYPKQNHYSRDQPKITDLQLFLKALTKQIQFDQDFRNTKRWFSIQTSAYKWIDLSRKLKQKHVKLDDSSIKQIFQMRFEQSDPFLTIRQNEYTVNDLVDNFIRCQQHWFQNIVKKYSSNMKFDLQRKVLSITRKQQIQVQDLVKLINFEIGGQYRNRDLILIYERFLSEDELRIQDIIQVACK